MGRGTKTEKLDHLQDANKKLRAQVLQLRKQVRIMEQEMLLLQEIWQVDISEARAQRKSRLKAKAEPICPQCGNPGYKLTKVGIWSLGKCDMCEYVTRTQEVDNDK